MSVTRAFTRLVVVPWLIVGLIAVGVWLVLR